MPLLYQRLQRVILSALVLMLVGIVTIMGITHHLLDIMVHRLLFMRHIIITLRQELFTQTLIIMRHEHRLGIIIMIIGRIIMAIKAGTTAGTGTMIDIVQVIVNEKSFN